MDLRGLSTDVGGVVVSSARSACVVMNADRSLMPRWWEETELRDMRLEDSHRNFAILATALLELLGEDPTERAVSCSRVGDKWVVSLSGRGGSRERRHWSVADEPSRTRALAAIVAELSAAVGC
jgi:hypothetical protein